jgi:hypothetical protein
LYASAFAIVLSYGLVVDTTGAVHGWLLADSSADTESAHMPAAELSPTTEVVQD